MTPKIIGLLICIILGSGAVTMWVANSDPNNSVPTASEKERAFMERAPAPEAHKRF